jgi:hypothetical protein
VPLRFLVPAAAGVVLLALAALLAYDAVVATGVLVAGATLVGLAGAAHDWERHPSFEERELARARKRKERWEATAGDRARDRARWEAYRAGKAAKEQRRG